MYDSNEVKWIDAASLSADPDSRYSSSELEEAPEILITDLSDLKKLHRIFQSDSGNSAGTKHE